jgi:hypothetical protein
MEDIKLEIISLKDSVSSRKSGSAYLNSLVCEFRKRKSQQNRKYCAEGLPEFFDRFETKTIGIEMNKSCVSLMGAIMPCSNKDVPQPRPVLVTSYALQHA